MPIKRSAKKALRQNLKRRKRNLARKKEIRQLKRQYLLALKNKDKEKAKEILPKLYSILDKSAKRNIIHKNKASRLKGRLTKKLSQL
jgi:small subunit ribosomal protein S20